MRKALRSLMRSYAGRIIMQHKLILVEGIPGAGKTTTARKIKKDLMDQGFQVNLYEEGMSHPADISWQAVLLKEEYDEFKQECLELWRNSKKSITSEELMNLIEEQVRLEEDYALLAYTKIRFPEEQYWNLMGKVASKEMCDGRSSLFDFKKIHLKRWSNFAQKVSELDEVNIFECAFLQNHIFELMGVYEKSDEEILFYLRELMETVKDLNPMIVYIKPDSVEAVIGKAAEERKAPNTSRKDWIDEISDWVSNSNYGKHHNLQGKTGVIEFCSERLRLDQYMLKHLGIPVQEIHRESVDFD